jgi:F0F1-type ATP synthase membrane subunit b/b'
MMKGFALGVVVGGIAMWVWRDSIREYVQNSAAPARSKADRVLRTVQQKSEGLLDSAKEQIASTLETARDRIRPVGSADTRGGP